MRILICEDERPTAEDIMMLSKKILGKSIVSIHIETTLKGALSYINEKTIDLLLLDLNLNSRDGFEILKEITSKAFHTIVISANTDRAIEAFEYGVLDFIPKPYSISRLTAAFQRLENTNSPGSRSVKYLSVKKGYEIQVIPINEINYIKSANTYTELHLLNNKVELYDKSIKQLETLLSGEHFRIHKSYIVKISNICKLITGGGGKYTAVLKDNTHLPISRREITVIRNLLDA